jgi:hypothetical protein
MFHLTNVLRLLILQCLNLLRRSAREYYRAPEANCTSWSYSTPSPLLKSEANTICGLEIYTTKQAFSDQLNDPKYFQPYRKAVEDESLYKKPAEHTAWYPSGGFMARGTNAEPFANAIISLSLFICRDREAVLKRLECVLSDEHWLCADMATVNSCRG